MKWRSGLPRLHFPHRISASIVLSAFWTAAWIGKIHEVVEAAFFVCVLFGLRLHSGQFCPHETGGLRFSSVPNFLELPCEWCCPFAQNEAFRQCLVQLLLQLRLLLSPDPLRKFLTMKSGPCDSLHHWLDVVQNGVPEDPCLVFESLIGSLPKRHINGFFRFGLSL